MRERPILFSGPMVRAILGGRKTQTRRVVKRQPHADCSRIEVDFYHPTVIDKSGDEAPGDEIFGAYSLDGEWGAKCPYGQPGDRLWVRETWCELYEDHFAELDRPRDVLVNRYDYPRRNGAAYRAECSAESDEIRASYGYRWKPSIHMPRWASRLSLEVVGVRVERVKDISRADAKAEGFLPSEYTGLESWNGQMYGNAELAFAACWRDINGPESWDANPWVWVLWFKLVMP